MRDVLAVRSDATPGATAIVEAETGTTRTYAALDDAVVRMAGRLQAHGVTAGDHVGVVMETRPAFVEVVHATMRLGGVCVPLNARLTAAELEGQVERADLSLLVCAEETERTARAASRAVPVVSVDETRLDATSGTVDPAAWRLDDPQVIMFTSGTTEQPKAVVLTAGNLLSSASASAFRLGVRPDDRWHLCLPMYHVSGLAPVLRSTLYGTTVILQEGFDPGATITALHEHQASGISLVPTMLRRLFDAGDLPDSLRFVLLGGAPAPRELIERCRRRDVPVCPTYGMTETASQIATALPAEAFEQPGTVGHPLMSADLSVRDETGTRLPPGEPGELVVSGPMVSDGYYDEASEDGSFTPHGLHTGDVGYRDDAGLVWVLNRLDDRIVSGGETVDPGEVVDVLHSHAAVASAAVVGLEDGEWGERVAALVVTDDETTPTADELRAYCRERLAGYKLPRTIAFASSLPRTASGTVDREVVRRVLRDA